MEAIFQLLYEQLRQTTKATKDNCSQVAQRIDNEVMRICQQSDRIQASGEVEAWAKNLANHRLKQCLHFYNLGSHRGRIELQSTLSAIIYRYIAPNHARVSYQGRVNLIEDFLQSFYVETLNAFRRETKLTPQYSPRTLLELAEYMAFTERYAKRRINLSGHRSQQLIILRAQTFSQQQPPETCIDFESAVEGSFLSADDDWDNATIQQLRELFVAQEASNSEVIADNLRETVIQELIDYLEERQQHECANYFILRLQDLSASEIEKILGLTSRQRDYLQQRFKYHLIRFAMSHRWELVHQWLEADLDHNLGLTSSQWHQFQNQLNPNQAQLLQLKQRKLSKTEIADKLFCSVSQIDKQWLQVLEVAWDIRNQSL